MIGGEPPSRNGVPGGAPLIAPLGAGQMAAPMMSGMAPAHGAVAMMSELLTRGYPGGMGGFAATSQSSSLVTT